MSNTWRARREKALKRMAAVTSGDLEQCRKVLWIVIEDGIARMDGLTDADTAGFSKCATAITSAVREYRELVATTELEGRISEIEKRQTNTGWSARA